MTFVLNKVMDAISTSYIAPTPPRTVITYRSTHHTTLRTFILYRFCQVLRCITYTVTLYHIPMAGRSYF